ncbi:hypothetical protein ABPG74_012849 [Tetrahymena malaccensis]
MGNCMDNKPQAGIQDDGNKPVANHGQFAQNQQFNIQENEEYRNDVQQNRYQDYNYKANNYGNGSSQIPAANPKKKIDFERLGNDFMFYEDIKKYYDDSPWQRDENDNSNRPNTIQFANNARQPQPNGLAIRGQQQQTNQSMYGVSNINNNQSMNRSIDLGYSQSVLLTNRKKQNIFYDASTYNQNPYIKGVQEAAPQRKQALQSPYVNFSTISYR